MMKATKTTTRWMLTILACLSLLATACEPDKKADADAPEATSPGAETQSGDEAKPGAAAEAGEAEETNAKSKPGTVAVAKDGSTFEPPVEKSKIPEGAWYCDMGTVHYARMDKGDGKCPECGMMLKHMAGAPAEGDEAHHHGEHHDGEHHDSLWARAIMRATMGTITDP